MPTSSAFSTSTTATPAAIPISSTQTVELVFTAPLQWQLRDQGFDITDTAVSFTDKGFVIWADDTSTDPEVRKDGSYVIAKAMKWRFL